MDKVTRVFPEKSYVYAIIVDGTVRYIGKGTGDRMHFHLKLAERINRLHAGKTQRLFYYKLAQAIRFGSNIEVKIFQDGMTDKQAFDMEMLEISKRDGLWNQTEGGDGFTSTLVKQMRIEKRDKYLIIARDPKRIAKVSAVVAERNKSEAGRKSSSKNMRMKWEDPKFRAHVIARRTKYLNQPEVIDKLIEHNRSSKMRAVTAKRNRSMIVRAAACDRGANRRELKKLADVCGALGFGS